MANVWKQRMLETLGQAHGTDSPIIQNQEQLRLKLKLGSRKLKSRYESYIKSGTVKEGKALAFDGFNDVARTYQEHSELTMLTHVLNKMTEFEAEAEELRSQMHVEMMRDIVAPVDQLAKDLKASKAAKLNFDKHRLEYDAELQKLNNLKKSKSTRADRLQQSEALCAFAKTALEDAGRQAAEAMVHMNSTAEKETIDRMMLYIDMNKKYHEKALRSLRKFDADMEEVRRYVQSRSEDIEYAKARAKSVMIKQLHAATPTAPQKTEYFGVPLAQLLTREGTELPSLITNAFAYLIQNNGLQDEGIFRVAATKTHVTDYVTLLDSGKDADFMNRRPENTVVCDLVKLFLRELPEPLLTHQLYDAFLATANQSNEEARVEQLAAVASSLPIENFRLAAYLFAFLYQVASHSEKNKMGHANLATIFGPNVLAPRQYTPTTMAEQMAMGNLVLVSIIRYQERIFRSNSIPTPNFNTGTASLSSSVTQGISWPTRQNNLPPSPRGQAGTPPTRRAQDNAAPPPLAANWKGISRPTGEIAGSGTPPSATPVSAVEQLSDLPPPALAPRPQRAQAPPSPPVFSAPAVSAELSPGRGSSDRPPDRAPPVIPLRLAAGVLPPPVSPSRSSADLPPERPPPSAPGRVGPALPPPVFPSAPPSAWSKGSDSGRKARPVGLIGTDQLYQTGALPDENPSPHDQ